MKTEMEVFAFTEKEAEMLIDVKKMTGRGLKDLMMVGAEFFLMDITRAIKVAESTVQGRGVHLSGLRRGQGHGEGDASGPTK